MTVAELTPLQLYSVVLVAVVVGGVLPIFFWQYIRDEWATMNFGERAKFYIAAAGLYAIPAYLALTVI